MVSQLLLNVLHYARGCGEIPLIYHIKFQRTPILKSFKHDIYNVGQSDLAFSNCEHSFLEYLFCVSSYYCDEVFPLLIGNNKEWFLLFVSICFFHFICDLT